MSRQQVCELAILDGEGARNIFSSGDRYEIPLYQRSYAWGEDQITRLIEDIADIEEDGSRKYYLGSLVVSPCGESVFEVIDGQQRLTTLYLLLDALGEDVGGGERPSLSFACREKSDYTLARLRELDSPEGAEDQLVEAGLVEGRKIIVEKLKADFGLPGNASALESLRRKLARTCLYRIEVPAHTDLNRYFEIMNTRGEQLEQHEVLKAWLMEPLAGKDAAAFAEIWDACSDMSCYVQMRFEPGVRRALFGGFRNEMPTEEGIRSIDWGSGKEGGGLKIRDIIASDPPSGDGCGEAEDDPSRFESIIDFRFFLLHALKVFVAIKGIENSSGDGPIVASLLDDKKLKASFERVVRDGRWNGGAGIDRARFSREFIVCLIQTRFLFDKCIIKREFAGGDSEGKWSLKEFWQSEKTYDYAITKFKKRPRQQRRTTERDNKQILMMESCLRVSHTSPKAMHWITNALVGLMRDSRLASSFDFLGLVEKGARDAASAFLAEGAFGQGINTPHVVFNYLDYLIWKSDREKYKSFVFEFRTSIEHWYPQNPSEDMFEPWDEVDRFGNLCLLQRSVNSRFSNLHPAAKKASYPEMIGKGSLKLRLMAESTGDAGEWKNAACRAHEEEMLRILRDACGMGDGESSEEDGDLGLAAD